MMSNISQKWRRVLISTAILGTGLALFLARSHYHLGEVFESQVRGALNERFLQNEKLLEAQTAQLRQQITTMVQSRVGGQPALSASEQFFSGLALFHQTERGWELQWQEAREKELTATQLSFLTGQMSTARRNEITGYKWRELNPYFSVMMPVELKSANSSENAVVVAWSVWSPLTSWLAASNRPESENLIVDENGLLWSHTDVAEVGRSMREHPLVKRFLNGSGGEIQASQDLSGRATWGGFARVGQSNWYLIASERKPALVSYALASDLGDWFWLLGWLGLMSALFYYIWSEAPMSSMLARPRSLLRTMSAETDDEGAVWTKKIMSSLKPLQNQILVQSELALARLEDDSEAKRYILQVEMTTRRLLQLGEAFLSNEIPRYPLRVVGSLREILQRAQTWFSLHGFELDFKFENDGELEMNMDFLTEAIRDVLSYQMQRLQQSKIKSCRLRLRTYGSHLELEFTDDGPIADEAIFSIGKTTVLESPRESLALAFAKRVFDLHGIHMQFNQDGSWLLLRLPVEKLLDVDTEETTRFHLSNLTIHEQTESGWPKPELTREL